MKPAFLDSMSWEMAEVYGAVSDQILVNLAKYFPYWTKDTVPRSSFTYQAQMLAQMGKVNAESLRIIREGLKDADFVLKESLEVAIMDSIRKTEPQLYKAAFMGLLEMPKQPPVLAANQMRAFQTYYTQSADKLNLVNTVMLESTQQAYQATVSDIVNRIQYTQSALNIGAGETITGVSSWNQAMVHSINRMKQNGITGFIDHAGRHWSAEAYTAMDIRTTMFNTARAAVWEVNQDFGNDLYKVSYHDGARPLCYPWQNKVISATNNARTVIDLDGNEIHVYAQNETSYGEAAGLFGINCGHYPIPFIPGVSVVDETDQQTEEENDKTYKESQEQRRLERTLREEKRDLMMLKAQNAPEDVIAAQRERCNAASTNIDEFCEQTGRARRRNREGVYTKREFPAVGSYDATQFTDEQKRFIERYYKTGGEQKAYTFGQMKQNVPLVATPVAPVPQNVVSQTTKTQPNADTIETAKLDATNFPDSFNKKKTQTFVDAVNATEGTNPDVVELFNKMGEQVNGAGYPVTISYTEDGHAVGDYVYFTGKRAKITVKVPKLADAEYLKQEIGTTAHEWGHLFDHLNSETGVLSYKFDNGALPNALRNARPMSERVKNLIDEALQKASEAERIVKDVAKAKIDAISADVSKAISERNWSEASRLDKERNKLWKKAAQDASKASRKAHNGMNAVEDIYDAISGGKLRDRTMGLYGHGSSYYKNNPAGENAATETLANYCNLALAYPELFNMMAEEQPEIWSACGSIVKAMIGK